MKLLILSLPRTGSSKLLEAITTQAANDPNDLDLGVFEPQNPRYWGHLKKDQIKNHQEQHLNILSDSKEIYVKCIVDHISLLCNALNINIWNYLDFYFKLFDEVILLNRRDINKLVESFSNCLYTQNWHSSYEYSPKDISLEQLESNKNHILKYNNLLNQITTKFPQYPINYYEDLFSGNKKYLKEFLFKYNIKFNNYDIFFEKVDPKNKYRKN